MRDHGLLLANLLLFVVFLAGMTATGYRVHNNEQLEHGQPAESVGSYLTSGDFFEATFENWESEFLQMGMYVVLTAYLFQRGSSESKPMDEEPPQDEDPRTKAHDPDAPWPVRRGGLILRLYEHSLSGLFFLLFFASIGRACRKRRQGLQRGTAATWGRGAERLAVRGNLAVLVRVFSELAE